MHSAWWWREDVIQFVVTRDVVSDKCPSKMYDNVDSISSLRKIGKFPCLYDFKRSDYCTRSAQGKPWRTIEGKFKDSNKL